MLSEWGQKFSLRRKVKAWDVAQWVGRLTSLWKVHAQGVVMQDPRGGGRGIKSSEHPQLQNKVARVSRISKQKPRKDLRCKRKLGFPLSMVNSIRQETSLSE